MATRANEARDLVCISAADHGELYPAIAHIKEIGDAGSRCDSVELHAGIALGPGAHPLVQFVTGHFTEVLSPHPECEHWGVAQLSLFDRPLYDVVVAG